MALALPATRPPVDVMSVALGSRPHTPVAALRWLVGRGFPYNALQLHQQADRMGRPDVVEWLEGMGCSGRCVGWEPGACRGCGGGARAGGDLGWRRDAGQDRDAGQGRWPGLVVKMGSMGSVKCPVCAENNEAW